jgi:hypothetical protein
MVSDIKPFRRLASFVASGPRPWLRSHGRSIVASTNIVRHQFARSARLAGAIPRSPVELTVAEGDLGFEKTAAATSAAAPSSVRAAPGDVYGSSRSPFATPMQIVNAGCRMRIGHFA